MTSWEQKMHAEILQKVIRQEMHKIPFSERYTGLNDTNNLFMAMK